VVILAMQRDAITASLAPVIATLRDMESRLGSDPVHGLAPGLVLPNPTGWTPATELISGAGLTSLLDTAKQRWRAQPAAAAALAWKSYTYWLAMPGLIGYAAARRVPLPRPANVLARYSVHQPFLTMALHRPTVAVLRTDPLAASVPPNSGPPNSGRLTAAHGDLTAAHGDPDIVVCADDAALLAEFRRALLDEHLDVMLAAIRDRVNLGRRTLLGSLASGVAHALDRAGGSIWRAPLSRTS
jgi:hypothetical protein